VIIAASSIVVSRPSKPPLDPPHPGALAALATAQLGARRLRRGRTDGLVFGDGDRPFNRDLLLARAERAWKEERLSPIGLHECRHTYASLSIAAGINVKALPTYLGHSSITITIDRYGHLLPGNLSEAVALFDAYLERDERATVARQ
jgi:integrase